MNFRSDQLHDFLKLLSSTDTVENLEDVSKILDAINKCFVDSSGLVLSDLEFTVLTLQKTFQSIPSSFTTLKCKILIVITEITTSFLGPNIITAQQQDVVDFFIQVLANRAEITPTILVCADCLIEFELNNPGILISFWTELEKILLSNDQLLNQRIELSGLMTYFDETEKGGKTHLVDEIESSIQHLAPSVLALAVRKIADKEDARQNQLLAISNQLQVRYPNTFDLCVLQTIVALQEKTRSNSEVISKTVAAVTHPGISIGHALLLLEWMNAIAENADYRSWPDVESKPFDGVDVKLKKTIHTLLSSKDIQNESVRRIMLYCLKNPGARTFAAVFRVFRVVLWVSQEKTEGFPSFLISNIVSLANKHSSSLPHIVDFVRYLSETQWKDYSGSIISSLIDSFDDLPDEANDVSFKNLILLFIEASQQRYQFCQPREILRITKGLISSGSESKMLQDTKSGFDILELCQSLIRHQDYEIFLPELKSLLGTLEENHFDEDVRHRAGMLRFLVSQVATNSLKDAFDVDLSGFGRVEEITHRQVEMEVLLDWKSMKRKPVNWSPNEKNIRPVYIPVELYLPQNIPSYLTEVFGLRIDISIDTKIGRVDSVFVPYLKQGDKRKACLILELWQLGEIILETRATMTTIEGRVIIQRLEALHLDLEFTLSPIERLEADLAFSDLWKRFETLGDKSCSSSFLLKDPTKVLGAILHGNLQPFRYNESTTELSLVSPDNRLMLVRVFSGENYWHAEILVEHPSLLSVAYSLITKYSK